ncbi:hypothetical protein [Nocardiopsis protaetiae]|uniref:hypothetical protein n=2 Tax=Nocardiopsidaceae TaxID=83676 RepID=UPI00387B76D4
MHQFSGALLETAFGLLGALFRISRGRHARTAGFFSFRRRSKRVRRYAADPAPAAVQPSPLPPPRPRPSAAVRGRELAPPREEFPADEIPLVRPYYAAHERRTAHERGTARRTQAPRPAATADEHELASIQEQALARLRGWTSPNTSHPQAHAAVAPPPRSTRPAPAAATPGAHIPRPRSAPVGDLLAADPGPPARPAAKHRRTTPTPTHISRPGTSEDFGELAAVTRRWLAQQERREVRV